MVNIGHAMEVKSANEEALYEASNLGIFVGVISVSGSSNQSCSESGLEHLSILN